MFDNNVGTKDKILRIVVGAILISLMIFLPKLELPIP